ncbi:hypothetical protein HanXRQr2_Chr07g0302961 [Helianthus annuus]|uniref:Uncharacterized protein n=1 Tax=Helianthus annuus TaxID=4232 RepID=A0A9K3ILY4_HELAN|nr:hypothetical protein HanXRQr2_Chr07g0302961 [Helianthus annuus]KAJ0905371.1 hypothetical protein HanPSC8_Chr07g0293211 [Helianthus annuus]
MDRCIPIDLEPRPCLFGLLNWINLDRRTSAIKNTVPTQPGSPDHVVPVRLRFPIGYTTIQYVDCGYPSDLEIQG